MQKKENNMTSLVMLHLNRAAVEQAASLARPGDVVILSPASTSFDRFRNFAERGNVYKQIVKEL